MSSYPDNAVSREKQNEKKSIRPYVCVSVPLLVCASVRSRGLQVPKGGEVCFAVSFLLPFFPTRPGKKEVAFVLKTRQVYSLDGREVGEILFSFCNNLKVLGKGRFIEEREGIW